jgi:hypothetical protein
LGEIQLFRGACMHAFGSFFARILVVLFCWWCRALLPHIEESTNLEHFISVMSSRCLCLRDRDFSLSSDLVLDFFWLLITCLSFSFVSFLFLFSLN